MPVTTQTYEMVALEDPERKWELYDGQLQSKPEMTAEHNDVMIQLVHQLLDQLDQSIFRVRLNNSRVHVVDTESFFVPDVMVIPTTAFRARTGNPGRLEIYDIPLPLIAEVWSPSTGKFDVEAKLARYQQRQDAEIWRIHPYERTLTRWLREINGEYTRHELTGGSVRPVALPGVEVDFDALFDF